MKPTISTHNASALIEKLIDNLVAIADEDGRYLQRLSDGRVVDTKGWAGWEWTHGIGLFGLYRYQQLTGSQRARDIMEDWFKDRFAEGTPVKNINTACPFLTLAFCYEENAKPQWLPYLETWNQWLYREMPRTDEGCFQHVTYENDHWQQIWDDTLMMAVLPLAKAGVLFNKPQWVEEAKYQFMQHVCYLTDRKTGLWYHGWNFDGRHHFAQALWARGNSWITLAIPEFVEILDLQEDDALRRMLVNVLKNQVQALEKCQCPNGLWPTLLDDPESYPEASASAGFAAGIMKAVRLGLLDQRYLAMADKAVEGIVAHITPEGELTQVSFGTSMGNDLDHYRQIPLTSMPYGQSMAMLCLTEVLRRHL